mgnify:CR=1 FL=1
MLTCAQRVDCRVQQVVCRHMLCSLLVELYLVPGRRLITHE